MERAELRAVRASKQQQRQGIDSWAQSRAAAAASNASNATAYKP